MTKNLLLNLQQNKQLVYKFICSLFFFILFFYFLFVGVFFLRCIFSVNFCNSSFNQEFLRVKIYGSSSINNENTVSATFSVINSTGDEISVIERSWSGSYLAVDFSSLNIGGKIFVFPSFIYGKNRISENRQNKNRGIDITRYYNDFKQCLLLGYDTTFKERKNLYYLCLFATKKIFIPPFKKIKTIQIDLSNCKNEKYYSIKTDEKGNLFVEKI